MKKITILLFIVFATAQLAPAVMVFFSKTTSVLIADKDKGEEKGNITDNTDSTDNNKVKKDYADFLPQSAIFTIKVNLIFHLTEKIHPFPYSEKPTPPPNVC